MPSYAYFQGQIVPLEEAKISVMTNFMHYGTGVFEGIRGNWNSEHKQIYLFRVEEHYQRMLNGCHLLNIELPHTLDDLCRLTVEVVEKCGFEWTKGWPEASPHFRFPPGTPGYMFFLIQWVGTDLGRSIGVPMPRLTTSCEHMPMARLMENSTV